MRKTVCDVCGREIDWRCKKGFTLFRLYCKPHKDIDPMIERLDPFRLPRRVDVCPTCMTAVTVGILRAVAEKESEDGRQ